MNKYELMNPGQVKILNYSDEELANSINEFGYWDEELINELIKRADRIQEGIQTEYNNSTEYETEDIIYKAAEILRIEID